MVRFSVQHPTYQLDHSLKFKNWISKVISQEKFRVGEIHYILCADQELLRINKQYLDHDTLTDIITFPTSSNQEIVSGDIYISIDRITDNADSLGVSLEIELARVIVHGILHLCGYNDHLPNDKREMRAKEDYYLLLLP